MSCITAPQADDCWQEEGAARPSEVFLPPAASGDIDLPSKLIFGPLRAPCCNGDEPSSPSSRADSAFQSKDVNIIQEKHKVQAHLTAPAGEEVSKLAEQGLPKWERERPPTAAFDLGPDDRTAERVTAQTAEATEQNLIDGVVGGDDCKSIDLDSDNNLPTHPHDKGTECLIVRPPMPTPDVVLPVLDELAEMVQQHLLEPVAAPPEPEGPVGDIEAWGGSSVITAESPGRDKGRGADGAGPAEDEAEAQGEIEEEGM